MIAELHLGQFALLMLFVPAALATVMGLILVRRARQPNAGHRACRLGGTGIALGVFGLLTIVSAFARMVGGDPSLLLPYAWQGERVLHASQMLPAPLLSERRPPIWVARAVIGFEVPAWRPEDPAADPAPTVAFQPDLERNARLVRAAALLLRAGEIADRSSGVAGTTWMDLAAARRLLESHDDAILRAEAVEVRYAHELLAGARIEQDESDPTRFVVTARGPDAARTQAIAAAVAEAAVHADAEAVRAAYRTELRSAELGHRNCREELERERMRREAWRLDPILARDLPRVEERIVALEAEVVAAQEELDRATRLTPPEQPRVRILSHPAAVEPEGGAEVSRADR